jgi:hypothetical protein
MREDKRSEDVSSSDLHRMDMTLEDEEREWSGPNMTLVMVLVCVKDGNQAMIDTVSNVNGDYNITTQRNNIPVKEQILLLV